MFHRLILCKVSVLPAAGTLDQLRVDRRIEFVCANGLPWNSSNISNYLFFEFQQLCWNHKQLNFDKVFFTWTSTSSSHHNAPAQLLPTTRSSTQSAAAQCGGTINKCTNWYKPNTRITAQLLCAEECSAFVPTYRCLQPCGNCAWAKRNETYTPPPTPHGSREMSMTWHGSDCITKQNV